MLLSHCNSACPWGRGGPASFSKCTFSLSCSCTAEGQAGHCLSKVHGLQLFEVLQHVAESLLCMLFVCPT